MKLDAYIREGIEVRNRVLEDGELLSRIDGIVDACVASIGGDGKVMICGNGGSAADAQHFAAELVSRFNYDRTGLPSIALTTDTSILTAAGNDYGFESVFSRQVEALGRKGDVLIAISTSGNSPNVLKAIRTARSLGITVAGLTGMGGGEMADECDIVIRVPSERTPYVQEIHETVLHYVAGRVEEIIFPRGEL
jgi:D-sedoheptulose 7-phosphate isomerase